MLRRFAWPAAFLFLAVPLARAEDAIPPQTVVAVKHATVFIQVTGSNFKASGSGFVVWADKDSALIATNHHVISLMDSEKKPRMSPAELAASLKMVKITVVFDSGTTSEVSATAEPLAADPDVDLAVLRVTKLKSPPKPIDYADPPELVETMPIYTFGFPFGKILSTSKGSPGITVGKGSVSSLRRDDNGELVRVQIDGALNHGNSGGPVVDAKGQLVGVAVAIIRDSQGIGMAIPAQELGKVMKGRLGLMQLTTTRGGAATTTRVHVEVLDPKSALSGVTVYYALVSAKGTKPAVGEPLSKYAGVKSITIKPTGVVASGVLNVPKGDGDLYVQAIPQGGLAEKGGTPVRSYPMTAAGGLFAQGFGAGVVAIPTPGKDDKPPPGWVEFVPQDKTYHVWLPVNHSQRKSLERTSVSRGLRMKTNVLSLEMPDSTHAVVEEIIMPPALVRGAKAELEDLLRDLLVDLTEGSITEVHPIRIGKTAFFTGKEYHLNSKGMITRARAFVGGNRLVLILVQGKQADVDGADSTTFLNSCRLTVGVTGPQPKVGPGVPPRVGPTGPKGRPTRPTPGFNPPPTPGFNPNPQPMPMPTGPAIAAERKSKIIAGLLRGPEFADEAPAGSLLVGFEISPGFFANNRGFPIINAWRPIYRNGTTETFGAWLGPPTTEPSVKQVAKPGYAVGAITALPGQGIDGFLLTYMRINGDRLDPNDSEVSSWLGGGKPDDRRNQSIGGDGRRIVGLVGLRHQWFVSAIGLLYPEDQTQPINSPMSAPNSPPPSSPPSAPVVNFPNPASPTPPPKPPTGPNSSTRPLSSPIVKPNENRPAPADSTPKTDSDDAKEKGSNTVLILAIVGMCLGLLAAAGGGILLMMKGKQEGGAKGRHKRGRDDDDRYDDDDGDRYDDDDEEEDDRPRRRRKR